MLPRLVADLVTEMSPKGVCDACAAKTLQTTQRSVALITSTLGITSNYLRLPANCPCCKKQRYVTRTQGKSDARPWLP